MAFWRVAGFAQPSPIEQILDKNDYTLEELLDEDDIIQECKSLNGRLIAFLRERKVVEQLLQYLVQPPNDPDDPKKQYKYPFTACEVFCCEVEAIFNTLLEDEALLDLLFSLLDTEPPLSCKTAGYFGRVVGQLLLRKTNEMMQYLSNHDGLLEKLARHLDVTSIADVLKRLAGSDEQSAMAFLPMHTQWLVETDLLDMLLARLGPGWPGDTVTNAADVLTAIAHSQPGALSAKLMAPASIAELFRRALERDGGALVPALEVASALLRPHRAMPPPDGFSYGGIYGQQQQQQQQQQQRLAGEGGGGGGGDGDGSGPPSPSGSASSAAAAEARGLALRAMVDYIPALVEFLKKRDAGATQETPYGLLAPPLGRARLKVVELLAVLLAVGDDAVDDALMRARAMGLVLDLFAAYPFNNLLHHQVFCMLAGMLARASPAMVEHTFKECGLVAWLAGLPAEVQPTPRPGGPPPRGPLRAGYLGHVTQIANVVVAAAAQKQAVADALAGDELWTAFVSGDLQRRNEVEDVTHWECGRPASTEIGELGSEGDEYQNEIDLEQMQGMQPALYHRYGVLDDGDDDGEEDAERSGQLLPGPGGRIVPFTNVITAGMGEVCIDDGAGDGGGGGGGLQYGAVGAAAADEEAGPGPAAAAEGEGAAAGVASAEGAMEDDAVLLASSDEEEGEPSSSGVAGGAGGAGAGSEAGASGSPPAAAAESAGGAAATSSGGGGEGAAAAAAAAAGAGVKAAAAGAGGSGGDGGDEGFGDDATWGDEAS